jgi:MinD-like ATPase involved in chromosome partitioning or flagellar assembly
MTQLVTIHSFRGGTGKSNLAANIAWIAARDGARVAVLDTDLQSPGLHVVFGTEGTRIFHTLSDFVRGGCELEDVAIDVTSEQGLDGGSGCLFLLPSSMQLDEITRILSDGYRVERLNEQLAELGRSLELDLLLIDTHPGINRETMLSASICDKLWIVVRPDDQDFQGTAVLCEIAKRVGVPVVAVIANKVPEGIDTERLKAKIGSAFGHPVLGVLPLDADLARHGSHGVFAAKYPGHPMTAHLEAITLALGVGARNKNVAESRTIQDGSAS